MKILILASNPRQDLRLDREIRDLRDVIEKSRHRQQFEVADALAVRVGDLQDLLFQHRPEIVHFCGHGSGQQGLVFEGNEGREQWVRTEALSDLFRLFSIHVGCVLLNACYSETQADAIVSHIDYVIGMNQTIQDDAAIAFSKGFYRALGYECSIEEAFEFGCNAIQLEITGSSKVRSAVPEPQRKLEVVDAVAKTVIPEHLKPILKKRSTLVSFQPATPHQPLSQEKREEIQLEVDRALGEEETSLEQFRQKVKEILADRKLTRFAEIRLGQLRKNLGLSVEEANKILEEEYAPIRQAQAEYQEMLTQLIEADCYPFDADIERGLQQLQEELKLTASEIETICKPSLEAAEIAYQEKRRQDFVEQNFVEALGNGATLEMVFIPGGTFLMGQTEEEKQQLIQEAGEEGYQKYFASELPRHKVTVPPFFLGKFAVTQEQWKVVAALPKINRDLNPDLSRFKGEHRPVEQVFWHEAVEFCDRLARKTGRAYRLPSEAEWEYACRAGTTTPFHFGETITTDLVNYDGNFTYASAPEGEYREQTTDVGSFPPNAFGLYDMHGNVWEWCLDHWHENYEGAPIDGSAWLSNHQSVRMIRGGSWLYPPSTCRSAFRHFYLPGGQDDCLGFRVVCGLA